jgi:hypothetical protein
MEAVEDLDALRELLRPLAQRGTVVYLTPEGRRGTVVTHGFHDPQELERLKSRHIGAGEPADEPVRAAAPRSSSPDNLDSLTVRIDQLHADQADLRRQVQELQSTMTRLAEQLRTLQEALGVKG